MTADIPQLVEGPFRKRDVAGSIPAIGSNNIQYEIHNCRMGKDGHGMYA